MRATLSPPYLALLQAGFTMPCLLPATRCALTAPFHPYPATGPGGILSVALSVGSRRPGITWHPALWSPDFPLPKPVLILIKPRPASDCPADSRLYISSESGIMPRQPHTPVLDSGAVCLTASAIGIASMFISHSSSMHSIVLTRPKKIYGCPEFEL